MSGQTVYVTPVEVIAAIEHAKKENPKDIHGDGAFQVNLSTSRAATNNASVRYYGFSIKKKMPTGEWKFIALNLRFVRLATCSNVLRKKDGSNPIIDATLGFKRSSSSVENGVEQPYGVAKDLISQAFFRIANRLLDEKKLRNNNRTVCHNVQYTINADKSKDPIPLDDPIIRVKIPFEASKNAAPGNKTIDANAKPTCKIYDCTKPVIINGKQAFQVATAEGGKVLTYGNIKDWLKPGSIVSGVDRMDSLVCSNMGISLPSKAAVIMVIPGSGLGIDADNVFDTSEMQELVGAPAITTSTRPSTPPGTPSGTASEVGEEELSNNFDVDTDFN